MTSTEANVAVITGGASGIGQATATCLLDRGWRIAILDLEGKALEQSRTANQGNSDVMHVALDVTDEAAVNACIAEIERDHGPIRGLVNSAGIGLNKHFLDTSSTEFRKVLDVNTTGTFLVGKACANVMKERKHGAIVNIASISGLRGSLMRAAYGASKGAIVTLTQVMANDLADHGIRVNAVAPGPVETPLVKAVHTDLDRKLYDRFVPMARYGRPDEIASVIAFLLDDTQSGYVTAEIIAVDGGYRGAGLIDRD
ncbi:MAG: SDR family oxidoreductase [Pseudomonadota bacterium]